MANVVLKDIPDRILTLAVGALAQANTHAVFADPGNEHWDFISVTNTAHAGELFLKAIIAKEHPLLIFKDLFNLDDNRSEVLDLESLVRRGRTHDFEKLPQVLWVATGQRLPNPGCFERLRRARNSIQHFCAPDDEDFRALSLEFIYSIIDPLIRENFGLFAINYHEDHVGYDYVVECVVRHGLKFSIPTDFDLGEIRLRDQLDKVDRKYRAWLASELKKIGKEKLLER
ncbi:MAG TPA: hypothetical protein VMT72_05660 [Pseudolabrys sp.]|nr:hypothetical protein [Pseudolabrys sp.]